MRQAPLFLLLVFTSLAWPEEVTIESIKDLQWKNRIILISAGEASEEWIYRLGESEAEIVDRDIVWIALWGSSYRSNLAASISEKLVDEIQSRYFENETTRMVLIGKDGGVKDASNRLNLSELFALIDGMPMRRAEIRSRSN